MVMMSRAARGCQGAGHFRAGLRSTLSYQYRTPERITIGLHRRRDEPYAGSAGACSQAANAQTSQSHKGHVGAYLTRVLLSLQCLPERYGSHIVDKGTSWCRSLVRPFHPRTEEFR